MGEETGLWPPANAALRVRFRGWLGHAPIQIAIGIGIDLSVSIPIAIPISTVSTQDGGRRPHADRSQEHSRCL